jgi:hypothetical protein
MQAATFLLHSKPAGYCQQLYETAARSALINGKTLRELNENIYKRINYRFACLIWGLKTIKARKDREHNKVCRKYFIRI